MVVSNGAFGTTAPTLLRLVGIDQDSLGEKRGLLVTHRGVRHSRSSLTQVLLLGGATRREIGIVGYSFTRLSPYA